MSVPKSFSLSLSRVARQDITQILRYTGERWGQPQLLVYRDKLDHALRTIQGNPELGHRRDDLPTTHLIYFVGSHVIVYRIDTRAHVVTVLRILHQRMSLGRRF